MPVHLLGDEAAVGGLAQRVDIREREVTLDVLNTGSLPDNYTFVVTRPVGWGGENPASIARIRTMARNWYGPEE